MGRQQGVYYDARNGQWRVDKVIRGERVQGRHNSHQEAEQWLLTKLAELGSRGPVVTRSINLSQAAARYLVEQERLGKVSLVTETYMLEPVVEMLGHLALDQIHDGTLQQFVDRRLAQGKAHKTINLSLSVVRHILNLAARKWRVDLGDGRTAPVLAQAPLLTLLPLTGHQREPRPISWEEQRRLLPALPVHLAKMVLFCLNTGLRENVIVSLRWQWELKVKLDNKVVSVFEVPRHYVKGRKSIAYVVCNSAAQRILDSVRGQHAEFVFVWRRERTKHIDKEPLMPYAPVTTMNNTAWHNARKKADLADVHVHDLRHTVGMRLREAGVREETIADVLWHSRRGMTAHYSTAQVRELRQALDLICDDSGRANASLRMLSLEARSARAKSAQRQAGPPLSPAVPSRSLQQRKMV